MSASIILSNVTWSTPDGRDRSFQSRSEFGAGLTGLVGRNSVGKSTLLGLVSGDLQPQTGKVSATGTVAILRQLVQVGRNETVGDLFDPRQYPVH